MGGDQLDQLSPKPRLTAFEFGSLVEFRRMISSVVASVLLGQSPHCTLNGDTDTNGVIVGRADTFFISTAQGSRRRL